MTLPRSLTAYRDCEEHFESALASPDGIALTLDSAGAAVRYIQKLNSYRVKLRQRSAEVYPLEDPRAGTSPYDHYAVARDKEDPCRIIIREHKITAVKVERL